MTCIAGIAENGTVWLTGDSAASSGWDMTVRSDPKVFASGAYVMGFTGSFRMGQLLRYSFAPPAPPGPDGDLHRFMCTDFTDALRQCLKDGGWAEKDNEREGLGTGGSFLAGVAGRLFIVEADYQVGEPADGYAACGCGWQVARGALFASGGPPAQRLAVAMAAAERFSNGVRAPFTTVSAGLA